MTQMAPKPQSLLLAARIIRQLKVGLSVDGRVMQYIDSTYLNPSDDELRELFADAEPCQNASLFELVFSPDEAFQIQIESDLEAVGCETTDERKVIDAVLARPLKTRIVFPTRHLSIIVPMPPENVERFVGLLNLSRRVHPSIVRTANRFLDPSMRTVAKVILRNTKGSFAQEEIQFLCRFIEKSGAGFPEFRVCLELILELFRDNPDHPYVHQLLMEKKRYHLKNLETMEKLDSQIDGHNMETLLLKGIRIPYLDRNETKKQIARLDTIGRMVFGRNFLMPQKTPPVQQGECVTIEKIDQMIKYLS